MMETEYDMLYLASCALNGGSIDIERIKNIDLQQLLKVCKFHSLTVIVAYALESAGIKDENFQKEKVLQYEI